MDESTRIIRKCSIFAWDSDNYTDNDTDSHSKQLRGNSKNGRKHLKQTSSVQ